MIKHQMEWVLRRFYAWIARSINNTALPFHQNSMIAQDRLLRKLLDTSGSRETLFLTSRASRENVKSENWVVRS